MNKKKAEKIIEDNITGAEGSLLHYLHERNKLETESFHKLINSIRFLVDEKVGEKEIALKLFRIYSYFTNCLLNHYQEGDLFEIEDLPENVNDYVLDLESKVGNYLSLLIKMGNNTQLTGGE